VFVPCAHGMSELGASVSKKATTRLVATSRGTTRNGEHSKGYPWRTLSSPHAGNKDKTYKLTSHALDARCLVGRKSARFCRNDVVVTMGAFAGLYLLKLKCPAVLEFAVADAGPWPAGGDCDCAVEWAPGADISTSIGWRATISSRRS
jgi:hypothetical protein